MTENEISRIIYECAIEAHRTLGGPGLLETVYEEALAWEVAQRGLKVERRVSVPIVYKGQHLATNLQIDLIIAEKVSSSVKPLLNTTPSSKHNF